MIWPVALFDIKNPIYFPKTMKLLGWSKDLKTIGEEQFLQTQKDSCTFPFLYNSDSDVKAFEFLKKFSDKIQLTNINNEKGGVLDEKGQQVGFYNFIFTSDNQEWYHHFCPICSNDIAFEKLVNDECEILNELVIDTEQSRKYQFIFG